jgi:predicted Zn-dependent peptidase
MNRTEEILKLRPKIKTIKQDLNTSTIEQFQNDTLRPLLKFQHDILLAFFRACLDKNKVRIEELSKEEKEAKINQLFQKDLSFKNQSLGAIIGLLTVEEYIIYAEDISSYNRRIVTMLKQRIMSTY